MEHPHETSGQTPWYVCDHEKKVASLPDAFPSIGGPVPCDLPPTSPPEGGINTGAALGQDGSYILASDRLPGTGASLSIPGLSRMDTGPRTLRGGRVYGPVRAGLRRACVHMAETAAAACCGVGRLRVLRAVLLSLVPFEHFMGILVFFVEVLSVPPFSGWPSGCPRLKKKGGTGFSFSLSRRVCLRSLSMQGRARMFPINLSGYLATYVLKQFRICQTLQTDIT